MRKLTCTILAMLAAMLVGCVTINVYFPEAAAQKAADQFIGTVLDGGGQAAPATDKSAPAQDKPSPARRPTAMLLDLLVPAAHAAEVPNLRVQHHFIPAMPIRVSAMRSLGAHMNVFAIESFIDELALAAHADPVAFRLQHLDDPRARDVIQLAASRFGWQPRARRRGLKNGLQSGAQPTPGATGTMILTGRSG